MPHMCEPALPSLKSVIEESVRAEQPEASAQHHHKDIDTTSARRRRKTKRSAVTKSIEDDSRRWLSLLIKDCVAHDRLRTDMAKRDEPAVDLLSASKKWLEIFTQNRVAHDRLFVDTVRQKGPGVDLLAAFLQDTDASGPSWQVEQARRFCTESPEVPEAKIWLDDRKSSDSVKKQVPSWMTSVDYCKTLPTKVSSAALNQ